MNTLRYQSKRVIQRFANPRLWISVSGILIVLIIRRAFISSVNGARQVYQLPGDWSPLDALLKVPKFDTPINAFFAFLAFSLVLSLGYFSARRHAFSIAVFWRELRKHVQEFSARQPWRLTAILLALLMALRWGNNALLKAGYPLGTPDHCYPIHVVMPALHAEGLWLGLPYLLSFILLLWWGLKHLDKLSPLYLSALCAGLVILGNLIQGDPDSAFLHPFTASFPFNTTPIEYYHEAVKIQDPGLWLANFNSNQADFSDHTRTHPPFAVLIQWLFLSLGGIGFLAFAFVVLSLLQLPILYFIFRPIAGPERVKFLLLLYALLPSINIYSVICMDALIAVTFLWSLLGLLKVHHHLNPLNLLVLISGIFAASALTFGSLFLLALIGISGLYFALKHRSYNILIGGLIATIALLSLWMIVYKLSDYNHLQAFRTASRLENPGGFSLLHNPWQYFGTRVENIMEIMMFFGIGALALWFRHTKASWLIKYNVKVIAIIAVATLLLMFVSGSHRVGETARSCLFIYPYLLIFLIDTPVLALKDMVLWAGAQTALMQMLGMYLS